MDTHDYRIDRLRLLACFGVVLLHSSFSTAADDLALNALFRFSVPVFVIISGYFMLSGPVAVPAVMKKSWRLFGKMVICSGIYLLYGWISGGALPGKPLLFLITEPVHLWYLYATMGLYILTPALYPFVRSADCREYQYALDVCFILGCCVVTLVRLDWIPTLAVILDKSKLPDMLGFTGLYLLGGYFRKFGFSNRKRWLWVGIAASAVSVAASGTEAAQHLTGFLAPNVVLSGASCFAICMTRREVPEPFRRPVQLASSCTMGVYLLHFLVSDLMEPWLTGLQAALFPSGAVVICAVCVFAATMLLVWLLRQIPVVRRWVL